MRNTFIIVSFFVLSTLTLFSANGSVAGTVLDNNRTPVIGANVVLHNGKDSTISTGTTTDKNGRFNINAPNGNYYLSIRFIGYESTSIDLTITQNKTISLDTIYLKPNDITQKDITIEAERELVEIGHYFRRRSFLR